jgi:TPR repeat protein
MLMRLLVVFLSFWLASVSVAAEPSQSAWLAAQKAIIGTQANGEWNRPHKLTYGMPDSDDEEAAKATEALLRQASDGGVIEAQFVYAMQLAGLARLASRNLPVVFSPLDRLGFPIYPQPSRPIDTVQALRLLHVLADKADLPDDERFAVRLALAEMNATFGPSLKDDGNAYAARIDDFLSQDGTGGLGAVILFAATGRCDQLAPRLDKLLASRHGDPVLKYLGTACSGPVPSIPDGCLDRDDAAPPVGTVPPIRPLEYEDANAAALRDNRVSDIVACLWRKTVEMSASAQPPLPAPTLQAREKSASIAIGWPMNEAERRLFASMGTRIRQSDPVEATRLLGRATPAARLEAARMLVNGTGIPPDAARARQILASAAILKGAIPATEIMLADMEFNGIGGAADKPAAIRRLRKTEGDAAEKALERTYDTLPWQLVEFETGDWQP